MSVGIRGKFIGLGALICVTSFALFSLVLLTSQRGEMESAVMRSSRVFAIANARGIHDDYQVFQGNRDIETFNAKIASKLSWSSYVTDVSLVGVNGLILFDSEQLLGRVEEGKDVFMADEEAMGMVRSGAVEERLVKTNGQRHMEIYVPVLEDGGQHSTSVRYVVSFEASDERLSSILGVILASFVPFMAFVVLVTFLFAQRVVTPIRRLDSAMRGFGSGRFNGRVRVDSQDEIGELIESFNKMAEEVLLVRQELEDANRELEGVVHQRNSELQKQNDEVKNANTELERMNKFMIGRELRMVELKNEIDDLKGKLGEKH